jgi:hypothetical protein
LSRQQDAKFAGYAIFKTDPPPAIPKAAVKEKAPGKIEISAVYVPSPLKRETFTIAEKIE